VVVLTETTSLQNHLKPPFMLYILHFGLQTVHSTTWFTTTENEQYWNISVRLL